MTKNRMSKFAVFLGTWNTSGEVLATESAPAGTLSATDTYRWLPGNHFLLHEVDARFGDQPTRSMEVIGYDLQRKRHIARSYDDRGVSEEYAVELKGKKWSITGETVRFEGKFDATGNRLTGLWEIRSKKAGWEPWIQLKLVRA